jgi:DNA primase
MIPDRDIEKAREIPLQRLLGAIVGVRKTILCPFHGENTPSFVIYPKGDYYCFGCSQHGSGSLDFLISMGYSFPEAVKHLTNNY